MIHVAPFTLEYYNFYQKLEPLATLVIRLHRKLANVQYYNTDDDEHVEIKCRSLWWRLVTLRCVGCGGQVDISTFVTEKVLNTAMRHLHMCLLATREARSQHACKRTSLCVCQLGMYQISGSGWPDIRPFFRIQFRLWFWPKWYQVPDISAG